MRVYVYKKTLKGQVFSDKKKPLKTNSKQRDIYISIIKRVLYKLNIKHFNIFKWLLTPELVSIIIFSNKILSCSTACMFSKSYSNFVLSACM